MGYKIKRDKTEAEHLLAIKVHLPRSLYNAVMSAAERTGMPASNIVAYAIDNELSEETPFDYPCEEPKTIFVEGSHVAEGGAILRYITKHGPLPIDQLVLARRDMGIATKSLVMSAIREILNRKILVDMLYPTWVKWHKFPKHVLFMVPKNHNGDPKQRRIDKLKKEINRLEGGNNASKESRSIRSEPRDGSETDE